MEDYFDESSTGMSTALARTTPRGAPDTPPPSRHYSTSTDTLRPSALHVCPSGQHPTKNRCVSSGLPDYSLVSLRGGGGHGGSLDACLTAWWIASRRIHRRDAALDMTNTVQ